MDFNASVDNFNNHPFEPEYPDLSGFSSAGVSDENEKEKFGDVIFKPPTFTHAVRPTLIIGLGGTGRIALVHLKAKLKALYGDSFSRIFRLLCLDTQGDTLFQVSDPITGERFSLDSNEFIYMGNVNTGDVLGAVLGGEKGYYKTWLDTSMPKRNITIGAGGVRQIGRMCLFEKYALVEDALSNAITRLRDMRIANGAPAGAQVANGIFNVFIISSTSGGTGSSMFLDMAHIVRRLARESNITSAFITGILALPSVITTRPEPYMLANHYASMQELNHFMLGEAKKDEYRVQFKPDRIIEGFRDKRPFDVCYWVDISNQVGEHLGGSANVANLIAECIRIQVSSQVGDAQASAYDNIESICRHYPNHPYSALGTAKLILRVNYMKEAFASYKFYRVIDRYLLEPPKLDTPDLAKYDLAKRFDEINKEFVNTFEGKLRGDVLTPLITTGANGERLQTHIRQNVSGNARQVAAVSNEVAFYVQEANRTWTTNSTKITELARSQVEGLGRSLLDYLYNTLLSSQRYPLAQSLTFLSALENDLKKAIAGRTQAKKKLQDTVNALGRQIQGGQDRIAQAARVDEAVNLARGVLGQRQNELDERYKLAVESNLLEIMSSLSQLVTAHRSNLMAMHQHMKTQHQKLWNQIGTSRQYVTFMGTALERPLFTDDNINIFYTEYVEKQPINETPLGTLSDWFKEFLGRAGNRRTNLSDMWQREMGKAEKDFAFIDTLSVREILDRNTLTAKLTELDEFSKVFLGFSPNLTDLEPRTKVDYGVDDADATIYSELQLLNTNFVRTNQPHEIIIYKTVHGIPLHILTQYERWKTVYNQYISNVTNPNPHIWDVSAEDNARLAMGLGLAADVIDEQKKDSFYMQVKFQSTHLGMGPGLVVDKLTKEASLRRDIFAKVSEFRKDHGQVKLREQCSAVIQKYVKDNRFAPVLKQLDNYIKDELN